MLKFRNVQVSKQLHPKHKRKYTISTTFKSNYNIGININGKATTSRLENVDKSKQSISVSQTRADIRAKNLTKIRKHERTFENFYKKLNSLKYSTSTQVQHNNYMNNNRKWMGTVENRYKPRTANTKFHKRCETLSVDRSPALPLKMNISDLRLKKSEFL